MQGIDTKKSQDYRVAYEPKTSFDKEDNFIA